MGQFPINLAPPEASPADGLATQAPESHLTQTAIGRLQLRLSDLKVAAHDAEARQATLQRDLAEQEATYGDRIRALRAREAEAQAALQAAHDELAQTTAEATAAEAQRAHHAATVVELQRQAMVLERKLDTLRATHITETAGQQRLVTLKATIQEHEDTLTAHQEAVAALAERRTTLAKELEQAQASHERQAADLQARAEDAAAREVMLASREAEHEKARAQLVADQGVFAQRAKAHLAAVAAVQDREQAVLDRETALTETLTRQEQERQLLDHLTAEVEKTHQSAQAAREQARTMEDQAHVALAALEGSQRELEASKADLQVVTEAQAVRDRELTAREQTLRETSLQLAAAEARLKKQVVLHQLENVVEIPRVPREG